MRDSIHAWLDQGPRPDGVSPLHAGTPRWLNPASLPPVTLGPRDVPWRHALSLAASRPAAVEGLSALCEAITLRRFRARAPLCAISSTALDALSPVEQSRLLLRGMTTTLSRAEDAGARVLVETFTRCRSPQTFAALAACALWPRARLFRHHLRRRIAALDGGGDWRALLLENLTADLSGPFGFAGLTAPATGTAEALRLSVLEDAMCAAVRWPAGVWADRIQPHVRGLGLTLAREGSTVGILHPAEAPEPLPERSSEPFAQHSRRVFRPTHPEQAARIVRRYQGCMVPEERLRKPLLKRGFQWGEALDYPRIFELVLPEYAAGFCVYVRIFPGFRPRGLSGEPRQVHCIGFLRGAASRPTWGGGWVVRTRQGSTFHEEMAEPEPYQQAALNREFGERLDAVPPALFSETLRCIEGLVVR